LILLRVEVGLLGEVGGCLRISFHSQVVQDQRVNIAIESR
jgi:hypothetical protein